MRKRIPIIDLFAGPGGLGEGFSSLTDANGDRIFQILMSVEMETSAHKTLRLRSFFRKIYDIEGKIPQQYLDYISNPTTEQLSNLQNAFPDQWDEADYEAVQATLVEGDNTLVQEALKRLGQYDGPTIIIGGPPCQAYSLVGRSRRAHDPNLQKDVKQTLYKCYLQFLEAVKPHIFVMENVKGILSAQLHNEGVLGMIRTDIEKAGYTIHSLVVDDPQKPSDYVVKAERYGIPQARHRVILLGIRNDLDINPTQLRKYPEETVRDALSGIPPLRSDFSRRSKQQEHLSWANYVLKVMHLLSEHYPESKLADELSGITTTDFPIHTSDNHVHSKMSTILADWYRGRLNAVNSNILTNHEARSHMAKDLDRYLFCSVFAQIHGQPAKLNDFPQYLLPAHKKCCRLQELKKL
ncbi:cytosine methyltransferase [Bifidobacterium adolescentis]|nr:cytosine methyltransferase [Bifidobacterium adolescentis]